MIKHRLEKDVYSCFMKATTGGGRVNYATSNLHSLVD